MNQLIQCDRRSGFDVLTLDSPGNRNALSIRLMTELLDAIAAGLGNDSRGLVLAHTGTVFCSGVDLRERRALGDDDDSHSRLLGELFIALWNHPKPVVSLVAGAVRGGGMGLVACSDAVVATRESSFAYSESRVGVAPALVMAVTLPSIPARGLMPWLLSGEVFDAECAAGLGLVTSLQPSSSVYSDMQILSELAGGAPQAQGVIKNLVRAHQSVDMPALIADMTKTSAELFRSPEAHEGMVAFAERRSPAWATETPQNER